MTDRQRRVEANAKKMKVSLEAKGACQDMDQDFLDAWLLPFANEIEWTLEQMKSPGPWYSVLKKEE